MATNPYDTIIKDSVNVAAAGEDASPTGIEVLDNWLYPNLQQRKEFGQQVALQEMQNDWSVKGKMAAAMEAGINPHTMAAGISGASAPSSSSPNSAIGSGASAVGSAAQMAQAANGAIEAGIGAYEKISLTPTEKQKRSAETVAALQAAGLSYWEAKSIELLLPDRQSNLRADTYLKIANFKNTCEEYHNIVLEHDRKKAEIDKLDSEAKLAREQADYDKALRLETEARTQGIELDNWWKQTDKDFWIQKGYRQEDPLDMSLRNAAANGKTEAAEAVGKAIETYHYDVESGVKRADVENAYKEAFDEAKANADVAAMFKEFNVDVDTWSTIFVEMYKNILENPKDIKGMAIKFINDITNIVNSFVITAHNQGSPRGNRVGSHDKPASGGKFGK